MPRFYLLPVLLIFLSFQSATAQSWTLLTPPERPLSDLHGLWFFNVDTGWVCGARGGAGRLYHTTDGGAAWKVIPLPAFAPPLNDVRFFGMHCGVVAGDSGYVASTTDAGSTWSERSIRVWSGNVNAVLLLDSLTWTAVGQSITGSGPRIARTSNGGVTWQAVPLFGPANNLHDVDVVASGAACAVGTGQPPRQSRTTDRGATWEPNATMTLSPLPPATSLSFYDITTDPWSGASFIAGGKVFASPQWAEVRFSRDGGSVWAATSMTGSSSPFPRPAGSVAPVGDRALFVPTRGGAIWRSLDGGGSWYVESLPTPVGSKDLRKSQVLVDSNTLFVVGLGGVILRRRLVPVLDRDRDEIVVGPSRQASLAVKNIGDGLLRFDSAVIVQPFDPRVRFSMTRAVAPGEVLYPSYDRTWSFQVVADSTLAAGVYAGLLRLFTNDSNRQPNPAVTDVPLLYALSIRALQVNNGPRAVGPIRVDPNISATLSLDNVLENVGNESVTVFDVRLARGTDFTILSPTSQTSISSGRTLTIVVDFQPTSPCDHFDTVIVEHDASTPGSPIRIPIRGRGLEASIQVTPRDTIDFGGVLVGQSKTDTLRISNAEPNTCLDSTFVDTLFIIGPQRSEFTTPVVIRRGNRIAPMGTIVVPISAAPTTKGLRVAQAIIRHELSAGIPDTVVLIVNGLLPELTTVQPEIVFGLTDVGGVQDTTAPDFLQNLSNTSVTITGATIIGVNPTDFVYQGPAPQFSLPNSPRPGFKQNISVRFAPTARGVRQAVLRFSTTAGDKDVALRGRADSAELDNRVSVILFLPETLVGSCRDTTVQRVIFNRGSTPLRLRSARIGGDPTVPASDDSVYFTIVSPTLPPDVTLRPGDSIAFTLRFCPQRSGVHQARLIVETNAMEGVVSAQLTAVAKGGNIVAKDSIVFAPTRSLTTRDTIVVGAVVNRRTTPLRIDSVRIGGADPTSFVVLAPLTSFVLDTGAAGDVQIEFAPKRRDRHLASLFIYHEAGVETVTLFGQSPYPLLDVKPSSQSNLRTRIGSTKRLVMLVRNIGSDTSHVASLSIVGSAAYSNTSVISLPRVLNVGDSVTMSVDFTPSTFCEDSATVLLRAEGVSGVYGLSDTAVGFAGIGVAPIVSTREPEINFGPRSVGGDYDSVTTDFVGNLDFRGLRDSCLDFTTIDSIVLAGRDPGSFAIIVPVDPLSPRPSPPGGFHDLTIRFSPRSFGVKQAELRIYSDGSPDSLYVLELFGAGSSLPIRYGPVSGMTDIDFGALRLGWERDSMLTVTNTSAAPLAVDQLDLTSTAEFSIVSPSLPLTLQPGVPEQIRVRFAPVVSFGSRRSFLRIRSGANADSSFFLSGSGLASTFRMTPDTIDFGSRVPPGPYDSTSSAINVPNGAVPLPVLDSVVIEGARIVFGTPDFAITHVPGTLRPGGRDSLVVRFTPFGPFGRRSGAARIYYDRHTVNGVEVQDSVDVILFGTVDRGRFSVALDPGPDVTGSPGQFVDVPLQLSGSDAAAAIDTIDLRMRFRRSMLKPVSVTPTAAGIAAEILELRGVGSDDAAAVIRLRSTTGAPIADGVVARVTCSVLLGDALSTIVALDSSGVPHRPEVVVTGDSLRFSVDEFCDAPGRLISFGEPLGIRVSPNPVTKAARLEYTLPALAHVRLSVVDSRGVEVARLVDGERAPGRYVYQFNTGDLPAGQYRCVLTAGRFSTTLSLNVVE